MSKRTRNYILGNISAGPKQWIKMYATGAGITTLLKLSLLSSGLYNGLINGSTSTMKNILIEYVNSIIPLVAVALKQPVNAFVTFVLTATFGLLLWAANYEMATR